jgi:hypothetical protein
METTTAFELNRAIQGWRANLGQSPALQHENLDELESHLRDSISSLQSRGLSQVEAFQIATQRLGAAEELNAKFSKANPVTVWRQRALWMLAGMLFWTVGKDVIGIVKSGAVYAGSWFTNDGLLLGWLGGGLHLLSFAAVIAAFWLLANGRFAGSNDLGKQLRTHPERFVGGAVIAMLLLNSASGGLYGLTFHRLDPIVIGQRFAVEVWFSGVIQLFQMAAMIGGFVWLIRRRPESSSRSQE